MTTSQFRDRIGSVVAVACLPVDDVDAAVTAYRRVLGFELVALADDGSAGALRRDGTTVMLRSADPAEASRVSGEREPDAWDAVIPLTDFDATFEDLSVRGVLLRRPVTEHPLLGRTFVIDDRFGNLLCFTPAPQRPGAVLRRRVRQAQTRLRAARFVRTAVAELRPHLAEFRAFYERLENKRDIFYMFFTGGLLHWAVKAESYVPPEVNLVLVGSDLSVDERAWIKANLNRPFHHVNLPVNDWPVWDFLLATNRTNFGWLDIDCLVLNPTVFREMADVPPDAAVNSLWSYDSGYGVRIANTYLVFVNAAAVRALRSRAIPVWARPHDWRGGDRSEQAGMRCFYRIPGARERRVMLQVAPPDANGRPRSPGSRSFFDTLSIYQILAHAIGFRTNQVRKLENPMLGPVPAGGQPSLLPQDMSDELVHVGGISYYSEHFHNPDVRIRYLEADYLTLRGWAPRLPSWYQERCSAVADELRAFGVEPTRAEADLREYLHTVGGLSADAIDKVLRLPQP
jgi:catechol 2,3-dioxygenase-like lactoylglutathione lyase family enzyme